MKLLFTDTHLDDNPDNEYRWTVFEHVHEVIDEYDVTGVYNLGDAWDRKDRFTAGFVNRLISEIENVGARKPFTILKGNHDDPLKGLPFFDFMNGRLPGIRYVTKPDSDGKLLLLPFTSTPATDWAKLKFGDFSAALMHVTPTGAISENGTELIGSNLPEFPASLKIYTGDVHVPQVIRNFTVVGSPHPIKFGDKFPPRMLLVDDDTFEIVREIPITTIRKHVIEVSTIADLMKIKVKSGDVARIRFSMSPSDVDHWGDIEVAILAWSRATGCSVVSTEVDVGVSRPDQDEVDLAASPESILRQFSTEEGIGDELVGIGLGLLRAVP